MEGNRPPRKNGPSRKSYKDVSTQTCEICPEPVQEICDLCHNRVLCVSSPNEIAVEDDLPDNICQCFFSNNADASEAENFNNIPEEVHFSGEQNTGSPNVQIDDSGDNLHSVEEPRTEESNSISKNDASSSDESKLLEHSSSSNDYGSSPSELGYDPLLPYRITTPSPENSPNAENNLSSNNHASSLQGRSFDQNLSDQRNGMSPVSGRDSRNSSSTEKGHSSGYPLSPAEQSSDENVADRRKSTSPSSGEDSKRNLSIENEARIQSLPGNNLELLNISECTFNDSFSSIPGEQNDNRTLRGEYASKGNTNLQYGRSIPMELAKFRSENSRPTLPPPFFPPYSQYLPQNVSPQYQPYKNPAINTSQLRPLPPPQRHTQPIQSYGNPTMNMPINRMNIPGRFPVVARPQITSTPNHWRPYNEGNGSLSKKLLKNSEQVQKKAKSEKIADWLEKVENVDLEEAASYAEGWSSAENEENEGVPPCLSETSITDDRSSEELSEEEYQRQRSLRRPPRKNKK